MPPEHTFKAITVREKRVRHTVNIYPQTSKAAITRLSARQFEKFPLKLELNGSPRAQNTLRVDSFFSVFVGVFTRCVPFVFIQLTNVTKEKPE